MTIALNMFFELEYCSTCGIAFAIPSDLQKVLRQTHRDFYCPNGHIQAYVAETEAQRLARELQQEKNRHQLTQTALVQATKDAARLQKRIAAGVCPCCKRTFQDLHRHMGTKHKDFKELPGGNQKKLAATA